MADGAGGYPSSIRYPPRLDPRRRCRDAAPSLDREARTSVRAIRRASSKPTEVAEGCAAVNKERARHGEAKESSRTSTDDISSGRRGGLRSHRGPAGRTRDQLYSEARKKDILGRSRMNKAQLERAVGR